MMGSFISENKHIFIDYFVRQLIQDQDPWKTTNKKQEYDAVKKRT